MYAEQSTPKASKGNNSTLKHSEYIIRKLIRPFHLTTVREEVWQRLAVPRCTGLGSTAEELRAIAIRYL